MLVSCKFRATVRRIMWIAAAAQLLIWSAACGGFWSGGASSPHILSLTISPSPFQVALGSTAQAKATGKFSDGTERDLTTGVSWTIEGANIAGISSSGVVHPTATGGGYIRADYEAVSVKATLTVSAAPLVSLEITPSSPTLPLGLSVQLKAVGHYADSSTNDLTSKVGWMSSSTAVATVSSGGQATSRSLGTATVSASSGNVQASTALSVTAAVLTGMAVTGDTASVPLGQKTQMHAVGSFTDGSQLDLTTSAQWSSSNPKIVALSNSGLALASSLGTATVSAAVQSVSASRALSVSPAALTAIAVIGDTTSVPLGQKTQMHAIGSFTDGSQQDVTTSAQWTSSNAKIVAVTDSGLALAGSLGTATISAEVQSFSASNAVSVTAAALTAIAVTSDLRSIPLGQKTQMHATGTFSDGSQRDLTTSAQWTSSSPTIVAVDNAGLATSSSLGTATISAAVQSFSASSELLVSSATLVSLFVTPSAPIILLGRTQQLLVTGTYTDGTTSDLTANATWSSSNPPAASVDNHGIVLALDVGNAQVTANYQNQQATAVVTVQPILVLNRFILPPDGLDTTLRIVSSGSRPGSVCAMIYVFDQGQQMSACCGCNVSRDGLLELSYSHDLLANPLTGTRSSSGTVAVIAADPAANPTCDAGSIVPSGHLLTWSAATEALGHDSYAVSEVPGADAPLADIELANVQAQCAFVRILGSGHGQCSCGKSPSAAISRRSDVSQVAH